MENITPLCNRDNALVVLDLVCNAFPDYGVDSEYLGIFPSHLNDGVMKACIAEVGGGGGLFWEYMFKRNCRCMNGVWGGRGAGQLRC